MGTFYSIIGFILIIAGFFIPEERAMFAVLGGVVFSVAGTILSKIADIEARLK